LSFYLNSLFLYPLDFPDEVYEAQSSKKVSTDMIFHSGYDPFFITFLARLPFMLLSIIFGILIMAWARELYGPTSSLIALFLYTFSITLLGNATIALTDFTVTFFIFFTLYVFWKFCNTLQPPYLIWTAILLGLALLSKLTAVILIPALFFLLIILSFRRWKLNKKATLQLARYFGSILLIASLVVWAGYGFTVSTLKEAIPHHYVERAYEQLGTFQQEFTRDAAIFTFEKLPLPAPGYFFGLTAVVYRSAQEGREGYFLGEVIESPPWYFFPVVFLLKTQLSIILLLLAALIVYIKNKKEFFQKEVFLFVPVALLLLFFTQNKMVSGIAHILPSHPFFIVFASMLGKFLKRRTYVIIMGILLTHYLISALVAFPHYHNYFNEFTSGAKNGHKYLGGANLQNGQHLPELKEFMDTHSVKKINLSLLGSVDPKEYGIMYDYMPSPFFQPWVPEYVPYAKDTTASQDCSRRSGWVVVDSNSLQGVYLRNRSCYSWLKDVQPYAVIADNIFVYFIPS
jgi:4-amino-4-deoxy-L-arabinose transferase-like glycosyltransferase